MTFSGRLRSLEHKWKNILPLSIPHSQYGISHLALLLPQSQSTNLTRLLSHFLEALTVSMMVSTTLGSES